MPLRKQDRAEGERLIIDHISHRLDQIIEKVERSYGRIFVRSQQIDMVAKGQVSSELHRSAILFCDVDLYTMIVAKELGSRAQY